MIETYKSEARYPRKTFVTMARWTEGSTDYTEILGIRTEDSSLEFNVDSETTTDIRGNTYTDVNNIEPSQTLDPFYIRNGSNLAKYLAVAALTNQVANYDIFDVYLVATFLNPDGSFKSTIEESGETVQVTGTGTNKTWSSGGFFAVKHEKCSIVPQSLGGDTRLNMPIEVRLSNKNIEQGVVDKIDSTFVFTKLKSLASGVTEDSTGTDIEVDDTKPTSA